MSAGYCSCQASISVTPAAPRLPPWVISALADIYAPRPEPLNGICPRCYYGTHNQLPMPHNNQHITYPQPPAASRPAHLALPPKPHNSLPGPLLYHFNNFLRDQARVHPGLEAAFIMSALNYVTSLIPDGATFSLAAGLCPMIKEALERSVPGRQPEAFQCRICGDLLVFGAQEIIRHVGTIHPPEPRVGWAGQRWSRNVMDLVVCFVREVRRVELWMSARAAGEGGAEGQEEEENILGGGGWMK